MSNTNWDKWAVVMSGLALVISIIMPIIGYYVLDPKLQELRHAPKIRVGKVYNNNFAKASETDYALLDRSIGVMISNDGRLPASDIKVVFHSDRPVDDLPTNVVTAPPCPYKVEKSGNTVVVSLERVIGNGQSVTVKLSGLVNDLETWVYSSQGAERITTAISSATNIDVPDGIDLANVSESRRHPTYTPQIPTKP